MKSLVFALFLLLGAVSSATLFGTNAAHAVSGSDWSAGRIIDDGIFYDNQSMSLGDIQNFLNSKVPTCDTQGTQSAADLGYPNITHAQYAANHGWPGPPYVCLKDYYQVPRSDAVVNNFSGSIPSGSWSAAQIIKNAADTYGVSPKALLVTLQKESPGPLLSDTWPLQSQYRNAMGYGCPDTAPCDPSYEGFYNQMSNAARQFKLYKDNPASYRYKPNQNNSIYYNPNAGCGASNVYIETFATAGLYNYTPYQPNQAALNNLYGTGDGCSAYGNRNFWRIYNDWFGSTQAPNYAWELTSQYAYTDSTKTVPIGLNNLQPGQRVFIGITAKNTGNTTWSNSGANPIRIGATRDIGRSSAFYDPTWLGYSRPAAMKEASVATGGTGTFEFWITAPESNQTNFREYFGLLSEGKAWMPDIGLFYDISVQPPRYTWDLTSQYAFSDDTKANAIGLGGLEPGQRAYVGFTAKNTGNTTWKNTGTNPIRAGTTHTLDRKSSFYDSTWISPSRPATMKETSVAPGQTATFEYWMRAPMTLAGGNFNEYFSPLLEGKAWLTDPGMNFLSSVVRPSYTWKITSQYAYTDSSKSTATGLGNLSPNQVVYVGFTAVNTGNVTWRNSGNNPVRLGTTRPLDNQSIVCDPSWISCSRPTILKEVSVKPGETGTFEFNIKAPATPGVYRAYFTPLSEGFAWMPDVGFNYYLVVK
jgi:hypothetical protein